MTDPIDLNQEQTEPETTMRFTLPIDPKAFDELARISDRTARKKKREEDIVKHLQRDRCPVCDWDRMTGGERDKSGFGNQVLVCGRPCGAVYRVDSPRFICAAIRIDKED